MASKRPENPVPDDVVAALRERHLKAAYDARPAQQRTDYLGWINRAKRDDSRASRIQQMLDELESGDAYMSAAWRPTKAQ